MHVLQSIVLGRSPIRVPIFLLKLPLTTVGKELACSAPGFTKNQLSLKSSSAHHASHNPFTIIDYSSNTRARMSKNPQKEQVAPTRLRTPSVETRRAYHVWYMDSWGITTRTSTALNAQASSTTPYRFWFGYIYVICIHTHRTAVDQSQNVYTTFFEPVYLQSPP